MYGNDIEVFSKLFDPRARPAMVGFFEDEESSQFQEFKSFAEEIGISESLNFFVSKVSNGDQEMAEFVGITQDNAVVILKGSQDFKLNRYKLEGNITFENIKDFYSKYILGSLPEFIKSEKIPEKNNDIIKKIVASNFDKIIRHPTKYIVLSVVDRDCFSCAAVL